MKSTDTNNVSTGGAPDTQNPKKDPQLDPKRDPSQREGDTKGQPVADPKGPKAAPAKHEDSKL